MRDCPPQSTCRIFLREPVRVKRLQPLSAPDLAEGSVLADLESDASGPPREARIALTAVVHHVDWWEEEG